jgi:hypothetical protein
LIAFIVREPRTNREDQLSSASGCPLKRPFTANRERRWPHAAALIKPVLDAQSGHLSKMAEVPGNDGGRLREGDAGDQEVGAANLSEFFFSTQPIELATSGIAARQNSDFREQSLAAIKPRQCPQELGSVRSLQDEIETTLQDLDPRNHGRHNLCRIDALRVPLNACISRVQTGKCVGVEDEHQLSSTSGRPRRR